MHKTTLFHCTPSLNLHDISKYGIKIDKDKKVLNYTDIDNSVTYASTTFEDEVYNWIPEIRAVQNRTSWVILLKFEVDEKFINPDENVPQPDWEESVTINTDIPAEDIIVIFNKKDMWYESEDITQYEEIPLKDFYSLYKKEIEDSELVYCGYCDELYSKGQIKDSACEDCRARLELN